jgi:hypothetical protein
MLRSIRCISPKRNIQKSVYTLAKLFIVLKGQTTATTYVEHKTRIGPFIFITREPQTINLQEYLKNQGYTIKIAEASTIKRQ